LAKENVTTLTASQRLTALAFVLAATKATNSLAQQTAPDPDAPETLGAETMPEQDTGSVLQQVQKAPTDQPDITGDSVEPGAMGQGMMNHGTLGGPIGQGVTSSGPLCSDGCAGVGEQGRAGGMMQLGLMDHGRMGGAPMEHQTPHGMMGSLDGSGDA
jgi:hypothetical protein